MADCKICKTSEAKEVIYFLKQNFNLFEIPEKFNRRKAEHLSQKTTLNFANRKTLKSNTAHREYIPAREQKNVQYKP